MYVRQCDCGGATEGAMTARHPPAQYRHVSEYADDLKSVIVSVIGEYVQNKHKKQYNYKLHVWTQAYIQYVLCRG